MSSSVPFGRRTPPVLAPRPAPAGAAPHALSPQAEAFRRELAGGGRGPSEFERWRRAQPIGQWPLRVLRIALTAPGALGFAARAPWSVSLLLEAAGLGLGILLARERRRRLAAVAAWTPEGEAEG